MSGGMQMALAQQTITCLYLGKLTLIVTQRCAFSYIRQSYKPLGVDSVLVPECGMLYVCSTKRLLV
jgi:hypothetical protein